MLRKLILIVAVLTAGCSQSLYMQGRKLSDEGRYDRAIEVFYDAIKANPQSGGAWRELGVAFYKKGDLEKAEEALKQAAGIKPDARTNLYIGLTYEKQNEYRPAIDAYRAALSLKPRGKTNNLIRAHLDGLISKKIKQEVDLALSNEGEIDVDAIPENTVAVVDFDDTHLSPELAPISRGLAEFTSYDLSKVNSLRVIERLKISEILSELQLSSSQFADRSVAPRVGRLLGSRKIITGTVLGIGGDAIRLDGAVVNTKDSSAELTDPVEGALQGIFKVQKDFVFGVIDSLGITLTAQERNAIEEIPTESYLAFLAYCRGLDYKGRGMLKEAHREFNNAAGIDGNFHEANVQAKEISHMSGAEFERSASPEQFETTVLDESDQEMWSDGLDRIHTAALNNSGFMYNMDLYNWRSSLTDAPPQLDSDRGRVIIRGNLDVD